MNQNNFSNNLKSFLLAVVMLTGLTLVTAQRVWKDAPTGTAPANNVPGLFTTGPEDQEKKGQLITSGIINNSGDFISFANFDVGGKFGSWDPKTPAYLFGDTYFLKTKFGNSGENELCVDPEGKVKVCSKKIIFKPVNDKYYTSNNVVSFPSGGVTGYVTYDIDPGLSCSRVAKTGTDWSSGLISGKSASYAVKFYDWGTYDLQIACGSNTFTATIKVGGRIIPTTVGSNVSYTLNLGATRNAYVYAIGAGGSAALEGGSCTTGYDGRETTVKIGVVGTPATIVYAGGGKGAEAGIVSGCNPRNGSGGSVVTNNLTSKTSNNGYSGSADLGGCSGAPDEDNKLNTCNSGGGNLPYGKGGAGTTGSNDYGGGGGAYASGYYNLPATGTLTVYLGLPGGKGGTTPKGQQGYASITW